MTTATDHDTPNLEQCNYRPILIYYIQLLMATDHCSGLVYLLSYILIRSNDCARHVSTIADAERFTHDTPSLLGTPETGINWCKWLGAMLVTSTLLVNSQVILAIVVFETEAPNSLVFIVLLLTPAARWWLRPCGWYLC